MASVLSLSPVAGRRDLADYIAFPRRLYRGDPLWAPQIRFFERSEYRRGTNAILARSPHSMLLVRDEGGRAVGRAVVYADPRYNEYHGTRTGFFGSFEASGPEAAAMLYAGCERWCRGEGLDALMGPIDPVAECWGFVLSGFDRPPVFMSPHGKREYVEWAEAAGFSKAKDLLVFEADGSKGYAVGDRFLRFEDAFLERHPGYSVRALDPKDFRADAESILGILNLAVAGNWGFTPIGRDEMDSVAEKLRPIADPDAIWFVEHEGRPVACALGFPDLNVALRASKGRLLPFGWIGLLTAKKRIKDYRLWGLAVLPEYHGKGLDVLLYVHLYRALAPRGVRLEANYVLEDNPRIVNALEKLGMERIKSYRVFEKRLDG